MKKDTDYLGTDKLKHFGVCFILSVIFPPLAIMLALGKELYDANTEGNHFCVWDLLADIIGIVFGTPLFFMWLCSL